MITYMSNFRFSKEGSMGQLISTGTGNPINTGLVLPVENTG